MLLLFILASLPTVGKKVDSQTISSNIILLSFFENVNWLNQTIYYVSNTSKNVPSNFLHSLNVTIHRFLWWELYFKYLFLSLNSNWLKCPRNKSTNELFNTLSGLYGFWRLFFRRWTRVFLSKSSKAIKSDWNFR